MKETIERLQILADRANKYNYPKESNMGVRISDIGAVLEFYEQAVSASGLTDDEFNNGGYTETELNCKGCMGPCGKCKDEPLPNVPDITPEWEKIPNRYIYVAIDENGEECAYSEKPYKSRFEWRSGGQWGKTGRKFDMTNIDWTKTLSKRPAK